MAKLSDKLSGLIRGALQLHSRYPGRQWVRSACIGCPYRTNEEWKWMRDNAPAEFADACEFDDAQR